MNAELKARIEHLEEDAKETRKEVEARIERLEEDAKETRKEVEALKRFKIAVTTLWAATLGLVGFFGDAIKKKLGI